MEKKPPFETHCIGMYLFIVDKYYRQFLKDSLKDYEMSTSEAMTLTVLFHKHMQKPNVDGYTQEELNDELHYDKAALTRTIKELEKKGLVQKTRKEKDLRANYVALTQKGDAFKSVIIEVLIQWDRQIFSGLTQDEFQQFVTLFLKIAANAENAATQLRASIGM